LKGLSYLESGVSDIDRRVVVCVVLVQLNNAILHPAIGDVGVEADELKIIEEGCATK